MLVPSVTKCIATLYPSISPVKPRSARRGLEDGVSNHGYSIYIPGICFSVSWHDIETFFYSDGFYRRPMRDRTADKTI